MVVVEIEEEEEETKLFDVKKIIITHDLVRQVFQSDIFYVSLYIDSRLLQLYMILCYRSCICYICSFLLWFKITFGRGRKLSLSYGNGRKFC